MKYTEQEYIDCGFFPVGEGESHHSAKVVKVRKDRICAASLGQAHNINKGDMAFREVCILEGEGWCSSYACLPCLDKWIDEHS